MAKAKDDDGEKEDELELMLLLGANEHRRRSRRPRVHCSRRTMEWMGTRTEEGTIGWPRYPVPSRNLSIIYLLTEPADIIYLVADKRGQE